MALTDTFIRNTKYSGKKSGDKHSDGGGMYLHITSTGKYWRMNYRLHGKQKTLAIGVYPAVSLKQAREARDHAKSLLTQGTDPSAAKREAKAAKQAKEENSFQAVALQWYAHWRIDKSPRHVEQAMRRMEANIFPAIEYLRDKPPALVQLANVIGNRGR